MENTVNQHEYSVTDDGWVSSHTVRPEPGRKYWNHMATHTRQMAPALAAHEWAVHQNQ